MALRKEVLLKVIILGDSGYIFQLAIVSFFYSSAVKCCLVDSIVPTRKKFANINLVFEVLVI